MTMRVKARKPRRAMKWNSGPQGVSPSLSAWVVSQPAIASAWPQNEAVAVDTGLWLLVTTKWWVAGKLRQVLMTGCREWRSTRLALVADRQNEATTKLT